MRGGTYVLTGKSDIPPEDDLNDRQRLRGAQYEWRPAEQIG
jgi:hypothetical protein